MQALSIIKNIVKYNYNWLLVHTIISFFNVNISSFFYLSEYYLIGEKICLQKIFINV